jgi:hypothetical protein
LRKRWGWKYNKHMWNWTWWKTLVLDAIIAATLTFLGLELKAVILVVVGVSAFITWVIEEINFVRNAHGTNIEEMEFEIDELKEKVRKLEEKK